MNDQCPFQVFLSLCTDLCHRFLIGNYIAGNSCCSLPGRLAIYTSYQCGPIPHTHNEVYRNFNIHRRIHPGTVETHFMVPSCISDPLVEAGMVEQRLVHLQCHQGGHHAFLDWTGYHQVFFHICRVENRTTSSTLHSRHVVT
jgi:hypothetical protein